LTRSTSLIRPYQKSSQTPNPSSIATMIAGAVVADMATVTGAAITGIAAAVNGAAHAGPYGITAAA
jgi:hypothetical protein